MRRVLLDEDVPRQLRRDLPDFEIQTVAEVGWSGLKNGELLLQAEKLFEVFVTADRNLPFQQNLARLSLGVIVLSARSTKLEDLRPLVDELRRALTTVQSGQVVLSSY
ncbi:MAG: hypothetical protein KIT87_02075 [Anaerolineae bacterium]|nr:hypothetical protein [Anaerolineae bacterium]